MPAPPTRSRARRPIPRGAALPSSERWKRAGSKAGKRPRPSNVAFSAEPANPPAPPRFPITKPGPGGRINKGSRRVEASCPPSPLPGNSGFSEFCFAWDGLPECLGSLKNGDRAAFPGKPDPYPDGLPGGVPARPAFLPKANPGAGSGSIQDASTPNFSDPPSAISLVS